MTEIDLTSYLVEIIFLCFFNEHIFIINCQVRLMGAEYWT